MRQTGRATVIDCDVHVPTPEVEAMNPHLPRHRVEPLNQAVFEGPTGSPPPNIARDAARFEKWASESALDALQRLALDRPGVDAQLPLRVDSLQTWACLPDPFPISLAHIAVIGAGLSARSH